MYVGVTEIAKKANVSKTLVSRYLNGDPTLKIRPETKERINKVKKQLRISSESGNRFSRNKLARNFVIPLNRVYQGSEFLQTSLFFPQICKFTEENLRKHNFRLSLMFFDEPDKYETFRDWLSGRDFCDGIILLTGVADSILAEFILENKIAHVSMDPRDEELGLNTITAHSLLGTRQAIRYLKELGHIKFGFAGIKQFYRYAQFATALIENDISLDEGICAYLPEKAPRRSEYYWREIAEKSFLNQIETKQLASAYICQNDLIAFGIIDAMRQKGLKPGRDISVVGYDNIEEKEFCEYEAIIPGLTTIDNPIDIIGRRCGQILLNQVFDKQHDIVHEHIPTKLIVRQTTGLYAGG